jgi:hypothetical protein
VFEQVAALSDAAVGGWLGESAVGIGVEVLGQGGADVGVTFYNSGALSLQGLTKDPPVLL